MPLNLLTCAWLPARKRSGETVFATIADLFASPADDPVVAIEWGRPDLDVATLELLIGILSITLDLRDEDDWKQVWREPPTPEAVQERLARLAPAFGLDGERPRFMQDWDDLPPEVGPIGDLLIDGAGGNTLKENKDLFVKRDRLGVGTVLSRGAAAVVLYALQAFAPSGGKGHRTSLRGGGPLTTLVLPGPASGFDAAVWPLYETLVANLDFMAATAPVDASVFPWCAPTRRSEKEATATYHSESRGAHPAQAFFGMPRRLRIVFEPNPQGRPCALTGHIDTAVATGFRSRPYGVNYGRWTHPLTPYRKASKGEMLPLHGREGRTSYADWVGLTLAKADEIEPATVVGRALRRDLGNREQPRLLIAGYSMDNAKALDFTTATVPFFAIPDERKLAAMRAAAARMVASADLAARQLRGAVRRALFPPPSDGKWKIDLDATPLEPLRDQLLARTERGFEQRLRAAKPIEPGNDAAATAALEDWAGLLQGTALRLFDEAAPLDSMGSLDERAVERTVAAQVSLRNALRGDDMRKIWGVAPKPKTAKRGVKEGAT